MTFIFWHTFNSIKIHDVIWMKFFGGKFATQKITSDVIKIIMARNNKIMTDISHMDNLDKFCWINMRWNYHDYMDYRISFLLLISNILFLILRGKKYRTKLMLILFLFSSWFWAFRVISKNCVTCSKSNTMQAIMKTFPNQTT